MQFAWANFIPFCHSSRLANKKKDRIYLKCNLKALPMLFANNIQTKSTIIKLKLEGKKIKVKLNITKWMRPAAVSQTETTMDTSWAKRIEEDVFNTFKYCRISGKDIKRSARKNRSPVNIKIFEGKKKIKLN